MKTLELLTIILFILTTTFLANAQISEPKVLEIEQFDVKGCVQMFLIKDEKIIKSEAEFLNTIRRDASRERCLKDLAKIDFTKNDLVGIVINSGYCRYPLGLEYKATQNTDTQKVNVNISYLKPNGVCRAMSHYELWLLMPKIPNDYQVKFSVSAR
jgi:hypothetical protein